jgi:hypothetical protein
MEAKDTATKHPAKLTMKLRISRTEGVTREADVLADLHHRNITNDDGLLFVTART